MTLNKHQGIRAALCWIPEIAHLSRPHNDANVLVMPGRFIDHEDVYKRQLLLLMVVVSCFTPAPTAKQVEAITFTGSYKELIRKSWNKWDVITSVGVVLLCALFYAYFW